MTSQKDFVIDQVSWHTKVKSNSVTPENIKQQFRIIVDFLQDHGLTARVLLPPGVEPPDDFAIRTTDLTEEGFEVIRKGYDRWLGKLDKTRDLTDLRILYKALDSVRAT